MAITTSNSIKVNAQNFDFTVLMTLQWQIGFKLFGDFTCRKV